MEQDQPQQEPVWEYQWEYRWEFEWARKPGKPPSIKRTQWFMTDYEAQHWWAYGRPDTRRIDETRRDRNVEEARMRRDAPSTGAYRPWDHPNFQRVKSK